MQDNSEQLNEEQRVALQKFAVRGDRGRAAIFIGRKAELALIRDRLDLLIERQTDGESAPGSDLTTVIQGAPGAGKSALLEKIAEDWPLSEKKQAVAISLDPGLLTLPMPDFLDAVIARTERVPEVMQILQKYFKLKSIRVAAVSVEVKAESAGDSGKPPVPVILLFDEIQTELAGNIPDQSRGHLTRNLRLLHTGQHNAPMFPVFGGLANSADLLRSAGLTRLAGGSELTLPGFSDEEMDELMMRFVGEHLSSARPSSSTLERWGDALRRGSQGWPMHCRNFLIALCEEIKEKDWRPQAVDLDMARMRAQQLRFNYYMQRMQGTLEDQEALVSAVLEALRQDGAKKRRQIIKLIAQAYKDHPPTDFDGQVAPEGMSAGKTFDAMLHAGIVQKTGKGTFACPIPSLASYIAAWVTEPTSLLHEAVLNNEVADMDHAFDRCRDDGERGRLLQAVDIRGRTPLMLALELGMALVVKYLAQAESGLPVALRSLGLRDSEGRTARDYAAASGDERMVALLDQIQLAE